MTTDKLLGATSDLLVLGVAAKTIEMTTNKKKKYKKRLKYTPVKLTL